MEDLLELGEYRLGQDRQGQRSFGKYLQIRSSDLPSQENTKMEGTRI